MTDKRPPTTIQTRERRPLRDNWIAMTFMAALLIASGSTATVVGYKIKLADRDRKSQLLNAYSALGGSFEKSKSLGTTLYNQSLTSDQNIFATAYEVNERARTFGLYQVLETTPPQVLETALQGLWKINATESAKSSRDAWHALQEGRAAKHTGVDPTAARFARQYDRHLARDTELKLFKFLVDNRVTIAPSQTK